MLDIHTHILPQMDDGSKSIVQTRNMLRREMKQGIDRIVLTPHFYANRETPDAFLQRRAAAMDSLKAGCADFRKMPELYLGAEVAFFRGISRTESVERLCIEKTGAMLIEMPFCRWNKSVLDELSFLIENRGVRPIIAHVERYMREQSAGTVRRLCEMGAWIQANTSFFTGWQTAWLAERMLRNGKIHFIGSDCHGTKARIPNVGEAIEQIEKKLGNDAIEYLETMERRLLNDEKAAQFSGE